MSISTLGFAVFTQALSKDVVSGLRIATERLCGQFRQGDPEVLANCVSIKEVTEANPDKNPDVCVNTVRSEPFIIGNLCRLDRWIIHALLQDKLWECASAILKRPITDIVYHFSNITLKPANIGPAISLHRDYPNKFICPNESNFVRLLIPLEHMSYANGGTGILVGSHNISDEEALSSPVPRIGNQELIYPDLNPGDALAIHPKAIHASPPNRSGTDRNVFIVQFGLKGTPMQYCEDEEFSLLAREELRLNLLLKTDAARLHNCT